MTLAIDLDRYTDSAAMQALLQAQLPGFTEGRLRIDALEVHGVRRNTSRERNPCPMTLRYRLQVRDTAQGRSGALVAREGIGACAGAKHLRIQPLREIGRAHV